MKLRPDIRRLLPFFAAIFSLGILDDLSAADSTAVSALIEASCIDCHDGDTKTPVNLEDLTFDLQDPKRFRAWEKVFDQVHKNKMPPKKKPRPDPAQKQAALNWLQSEL